MTVSSKDHQLVLVNDTSVAIACSWLLSVYVFTLLLYLTLQVRGVVTVIGSRARRTNHIGVKSSALFHHGVVRLKAGSIVVLDHVSILKLERGRGLKLNFLRHVLLKVLGDH